MLLSNIKARPRLFAVGFILGAVIAYGVVIYTKQPSHDRDWFDGFERFAVFEQQGERLYRLRNLRAFEFGEAGLIARAWVDREVDAARMVEAWFFLEPFAESDLFGHTFVSFVFDGEDGGRQVLTVSVEARREAGEDYSALRGVMRELELLYIWSTEKDILTRIAISLDHPLYAYRIADQGEKAIAIFNHFVERTNSIAARPRFYNTIHSNCTNELFKAVNDASPGLLRRNLTWMATGRSANWLFDHGFLESGGASFTALQARSNIQPFVKAAANLPEDEFAAAWRAALAEAR